MFPIWKTNLIDNTVSNSRLALKPTEIKDFEKNFRKLNWEKLNFSADCKGFSAETPVIQVFLDGKINLVYCNLLNVFSF